MKFTNSPYETMMQQVPRYERPELVKAPEGSRCHGCPYADLWGPLSDLLKKLSAVVER